MYGTAPASQVPDIALQGVGTLYGIVRAQSIILQKVARLATVGDDCAPEVSRYAPNYTTPTPTLKFLPWDVRGLKSLTLHVNNLLASHAYNCRCLHGD